MSGSHVQSLQAEQQQGDGKKDVGVGLGDSASTVLAAIQWWLTTCHEGVITAYSNVFSGWLDSGVLATAFGKSGNPFGIGVIEAVIEYLSGGEGDGSGGSDEVQQDGGFIDPSDYQHANESMGHDFNGFGGAHDEGSHYGQSFTPSPSPAVGDDHSHDLAPGG